jgi:hypothetical protein
MHLGLPRVRNPLDLVTLYMRMFSLKTKIHNTSYGQKKGRESKCQFDSQPLKVRNRFELCVCKLCASCVQHIVKKISMRATILI